MWYKRITSMVLIAIFTILCGTAYADAPYYGYTYDAYNKSVPSPVAYVPEKSYRGIDMGTADLKNPQDFYVDKDQKIYVLDSGNSRIVVLDENFKAIRTIDTFTFNGSKETLKNPSGIFVDHEQWIYVADTENGRVLKMNQEGKVTNKYVKPEADVFPKNVDFKPSKVLSDKAGNVYVIVPNVYQGAVVYDKDGNFSGFYGSNRISVTASVLQDYMWKRWFMTKEQRRKTLRYVPIAYSNFSMDEEGFIYTCSKDERNNKDSVKKLNSMGTNILRPGIKGTNWYGDIETAFYKGNQIVTSFVDIHADKDGFINVLDFTRGRIFQYDEDSNLIAVFGGKSNQFGTFSAPVALESLNGRILVLDANRGNITAFKLSEFGEWVHKAIKLYNDGLYEESIEPWKEVLKWDSKLEIANIGLGKAMMKQRDYKSAMAYFRLGDDRKDYSKAYGEYIAFIIRAYLPVIVITLIAACIGIAVIKKRIRRVPAGKIVKI